MRRTRPGIRNYRGDHGWRDRSYLHGEEPAVPVSAPAAIADAPIQRIAHPVVQTTHSRWFRVIRLFETRDGLHVEDIGEFPQLADAITLGTREIGRVRVLNPNGKVVTDNGQPIESRA